MTHDKQVEELLKTIEEKESSLKTIPKKSFTTNCVFKYNGQSINLHTASKSTLIDITGVLIQHREMKDRACAALKIKTEEFIWDGYSFESWLQDFRNRLDIIEYNEEKEKIKKLKAKVEGIVSEELKAKKTIEDVMKELSS